MRECAVPSMATTVHLCLAQRRSARHLPWFCWPLSLQPSLLPLVSGLQSILIISLPYHSLYMSLPSAGTYKGFGVLHAHVSSVACYIWLFATPWTVCSPLCSSVHGILQARILEWVARGSSQPRDGTHVSYSTGRFFITAPPRKPFVSYLVL